jgi:hypothetical protein
MGFDLHLAWEQGRVERDDRRVHTGEGGSCPYHIGEILFSGEPRPNLTAKSDKPG